MTTNYDAITDQFAPNLSPLARRMYAVIYEAMSQAEARNSLHFYEFEGGFVHESGRARQELIRAGLIEHVPNVLSFYRLTSAAWRAHLLTERAEREQKEQEQESVQQPSLYCDHCGGNLDNLAGMYAWQKDNERHVYTSCDRCVSYYASDGYHLVLRATSIGLDDALNGRR